MSSKFKSKEYVTCGFSGCGKSVRMDKRKDHEKVYGHVFQNPNAPRMDEYLKKQKELQAEEEKKRKEKEEKDRLEKEAAEALRIKEEMIKEAERRRVELEKLKEKKRLEEEQRIREEKRKAEELEALRRQVEEEQKKQKEIARQLEEKRKEEEKLAAERREALIKIKLAEDIRKAPELKEINRKAEQVEKAIEALEKEKAHSTELLRRMQLELDSAQTSYNDSIVNDYSNRSYLQEDDSRKSTSPTHQTSSPPTTTAGPTHSEDDDTTSTSKRTLENDSPTLVSDDTASWCRSPPKKRVDSTSFKEISRLDRIRIENSEYESDSHFSPVPISLEQEVEMEITRLEQDQSLRDYMDSRFNRLEEIFKESRTDGSNSDERKANTIKKVEKETQTPKHGVYVRSKDKPEYDRDMNDIEKRRLNAKYARSVDAVLNELPHYQLLYEDDESREAKLPNGVDCVLCSTDGSQSSQPSNNPRLGKITFTTVSQNSDFSNETMPEEFRNFKKKILKHEESNPHEKAVANLLNEKHRSVTKEEEQAAMACARAAYKATKRHQSQIEYEEEVACLAASGVNVGDINHSVKFAEKFQHSTYEVLKEKLIYKLSKPLPATGLPPPISVIADKITLNRISDQIVGLTSPIDGKMETFYLKMGPVPEDGHTGEALAASLHETLSQFIPENLPQRLVGGSTDGQYHNLGVPKALNARFKECSPMIQEGGEEWIHIQWDGLHIAGLAVEDAKKDAVGKYERKLEKTISNVEKTANYGKSYEGLINEQAEIDPSRKLKAPLRFSDTRFACYSHDVMVNFTDNYPAYYQKLGKDLDPLFNEINNADFVLQLSASTDIYRRVGEMTKTVQDPQLFPWQVAETMENTVKDLRTIADRLENGNTSPEDRTDTPRPQDPYLKIKPKKDLLASYSDAKKEVIDKGTFKDKAVFINKQHIKASRSNTQASENDSEGFKQAAHKVEKSAADFARKIADRLEFRYERSQSETMRMTKPIFSKSEILKRPVHEVPPQLKTYAELAKKNGYLNSDVTDEELDNQYQAFSARVHKEFGSATTTNEKNFYNSYLQDKTVFGESKDVAHLLAASMTRTSCEAVVEGMGSVAKKHTEGRGQIKQTTLNEEMFIHWNGPPTAIKADPLLREALNRYFDGKPWHFFRTSRKDKLLTFVVSKSVDSFNSKDGRITFD